MRIVYYGKACRRMRSRRRKQCRRTHARRRVVALSPKTVRHGRRGRWVQNHCAPITPDDSDDRFGRALGYLPAGADMLATSCAPLCSKRESCFGSRWHARRRLLLSFNVLFAGEIPLASAWPPTCNRRHRDALTCAYQLSLILKLS